MLWGGIYLGILIKTILCLRTDFAVRVLVLCVLLLLPVPLAAVLAQQSLTSASQKSNLCICPHHPDFLGTAVQL